MASALIVLAIAFAAPAIGGDITSAMERAVCQLLNGDCEDPGGGDAGPDGIPGTDDDPGGGPGRDGLPGTEDDPGDPGPDGVRGTEDDPQPAAGTTDETATPCVGEFDTPRCVQQFAGASEAQIRNLAAQARIDAGRAQRALLRSGIPYGSPEFQRRVEQIRQLRERSRTLNEFADSKFGQAGRRLNTTPDDLLPGSGANPPSGGFLDDLLNGTKKVVRHVPLLGAPVSLADNINKDGLGKGITETVFEEGLSTLVGAGGAAVCTAATVGSAGLATAACAAGAAALTVGAGEVGKAIGGFAWDDVLAPTGEFIGDRAQEFDDAVLDPVGNEIAAKAKDFDDAVLDPAGNTIADGAKTIDDNVVDPVGNVVDDVLPGNFP